MSRASTDNAILQQEIITFSGLVRLLMKSEMRFDKVPEEV
jgi:hypothetical protein